MPITPTAEFRSVPGFPEWLSTETTQRHILLKLSSFCGVPGSSWLAESNFTHFERSEKALILIPKDFWALPKLFPHVLSKEPRSSSEIPQAQMGSDGQQVWPSYPGSLQNTQALPKTHRQNSRRWTWASALLESSYLNLDLILWPPSLSHLFF